MNDPLQQLHDIQLPEPISTWPIAPGWIILLLLVLILLSAGIIYLRRRQRQNQWRQAVRDAQHQLRLLNEDASFKQQALIIIKQALLQLGHQDGLSLYGQSLALRLHQHIRKPSLIDSLQLDSIYQASIEIDRAAWCEAIQQLSRAKPIKPIAKPVPEAKHGI